MQLGRGVTCEVVACRGVWLKHVISMELAFRANTPAYAMFLSWAGQHVISGLFHAAMYVFAEEGSHLACPYGW